MHIRFSKRLSCLLLSVPAILVGQQNLQNQAPAQEDRSVAVTVTVTDHRHHPVTGLKAEDFTLFEDGQPQTIASVSSNLPACVGLLVDNSGSMRPYSRGVGSTALDFVRASAPEDRYFVVNFKDSMRLDQDFTRDVNLIQEGLHHFDPGGDGALYDAVATSAGYLAQTRDCQKRVLLVISDGADSSSRMSLSQTITETTGANGTVVYAIGLPEFSPPKGHPSGRRVLEELTAATGGRALFLTYELAGNVRQVAEEIRNQYVITYVSGHAATAGAPALKIEVRRPGHKDLAVRWSHAAKAEPTGSP